MSYSAATHSCTSRCWMSRDIYKMENSTMSRNMSGIFLFFCAINAQHVIVVHLISLEWIWIQHLPQFSEIRPTLVAQMDRLDLTMLFFQVHYNKFSPPSDVTTHGRSSSDDGTKHFWRQLHWFHRVFDTRCFADFFFFSRTWLRDSRHRHLPFELFVGYEAHNPIIVFNYYQNHGGTLFNYYPYFVFVKSVFFLIASFFTNIFASCVVSDPFELRLLRVHPFSFDEAFVFLCLWSSESHDVRRHEIVVKGLQFIDKIRKTHYRFSELIYWIAISLLIISRWTKCQCRFSQLLQKKAYVRFEDRRPDKHVILLRSSDIMQFACFWCTSRKNKIENISVDAMT